MSFDFIFLFDLASRVSTDAVDRLFSFVAILDSDFGPNSGKSAGKPILVPSGSSMSSMSANLTKSSSRSLLNLDVFVGTCLFSLDSFSGGGRLCAVVCFVFWPMLRLTPLLTPEYLIRIRDFLAFESSPGTAAACITVVGGTTVILAFSLFLGFVGIMLFGVSLTRLSAGFPVPFPRSFNGAAFGCPFSFRIDPVEFSATVFLSKNYREYVRYA